MKKPACINRRFCLVPWVLAGAAITVPLSAAEENAFLSLSARGVVDQGENILIGGLAVENRSNVLIRGIGPTLSDLGVELPVMQPRLTLLDGTGQVIATNTDWRLGIPAWSGLVEGVPTTQIYALTDAPIELITMVQANIGAFPPNSFNEAVLYMELDPGTYTAHLSSADSGTGVGLLEIYLVDAAIDPFPPSTRVRHPPDQSYAPTRQGFAPIAPLDENSGTTLQLLFSTTQSRPFIPGQANGTSTFSEASIPWVPTGTEDLQKGLAGVADSRGWVIAPRYAKTGNNTCNVSILTTLPGEETVVREELSLQFSTPATGTFTYEWGHDDPSSDSIDFIQGNAAGTFSWTKNANSYALSASAEIYRIFPKNYLDGRPDAIWRFRTDDFGPVLFHGDGPDNSDVNGAREASVIQVGNQFILHYDGCGAIGWRACRATSTDLVNWAKEGPILDLGSPGEIDEACACSPWVVEDGGVWNMFYFASPNRTPPPELIPSFPYTSRLAQSASPFGPWVKQSAVVPFDPLPNSYYSQGASPGFVLQNNDDWLQFFSAQGAGTRTLSLARTDDLNNAWVIDPTPLLLLDQQIENSSIYFEPANGLWFLFTNHIGISNSGFEYTDAVWVYWSNDPTNFDSNNRAIVIDGATSSWSKAIIGMPSVIPFNGRLALLYDGNTGRRYDHMKRDIGLAFLDLPLQPPNIPTN